MHTAEAQRVRSMLSYPSGFNEAAACTPRKHYEVPGTTTNGE